MEDKRHVEKVRSAAGRTIDSASGGSDKRAVAKAEIKTPARHAARTMVGNRK